MRRQRERLAIHHAVDINSVAEDHLADSQRRYYVGVHMDREQLTFGIEEPNICIKVVTMEGDVITIWGDKYRTGAVVPNCPQRRR